MNCCFLPSPLLCGMKGFLGSDSSALKSADLYTEFALTLHKYIRSQFDSEEDRLLYLTTGFAVVYSNSVSAINLNSVSLVRRFCVHQSRKKSVLNGFNVRKV